MEIYVMDAFSDRIFGGNQAGVALPERELPDGTMQAVAAEMKHSETAFVRLAPDGVHLSAGNGYGTWLTYLRNHAKYASTNAWTLGSAYAVN